MRSTSDEKQFHIRSEKDHTMKIANSVLTTALCAAVLATTPLPATAQESATTPNATAEATTRNERIITEAFETWENGTYIFGDILAPDVVWTIHGSGPVAGTYTNMEEFVERAATPLTSRLATPLIPDVKAIWAVGDTVIIRFDGSATTTSGAPYENQFVWIFRMRDGLVAEAEAFLDLAAYDVVVRNNEPRAEDQLRTE